MTGQKELRGLLLAISLLMTFFFGFKLAQEWYIGILFALTLVGLQASALLYLPNKAKAAFQNKQIMLSITYVSSVTIVLLMSITTTIATLSSAEDKVLLALKERDNIQRSIDGYLKYDKITKALTLREELDKYKNTEPTGLQSAAIRLSSVTGWNNNTIIGSFITTLSLLLDLFIILLTPTSSAKTMITPRLDKPNKKEKQAPENKPAITEEFKANTIPNHLGTELSKITTALSNGSLKSASVKSVRVFLGCGQDKAMEVAALYRQMNQKTA